MEALNPARFQEDLFVRGVTSVGALAWLLWEHALTCRDEYHYIWRGPINHIKVLYILARYFALCAQISNTYLVFSSFSRIPVSRERCMAWFVFLALIDCLLMTAMDIVIMLRVYALYNRSTKVALLLVSLLLTQLTLVTTCVSRTLPKVPFDVNCDILKTPHDIVYFMASVIISHIVLLFMTIAKRKVALGQSPVVELVVRDGTWVFVLVVSLFVGVIPYSLFTQVSKLHVIFVGPITLLSIMPCRLIMNMQKVAVYPPSVVSSDSGTTSTDFSLTSFIDVS